MTKRAVLIALTFGVAVVIAMSVRTEQASPIRPLATPGTTISVPVCDLSTSSAAWDRVVLYDDILGTDGVDMADFDGDGDQDAISNNEAAGVVRYCQNNGGGTSWTCASVGTLTSMEGGAIGDFDQDGNLDICITQQTPGAVSIIFGPSSNRTTPANWTQMNIAAAAGLGKGWIECAAGDVTGDGHTDIVIGGDTGASTGTLSYIVGPSAGKRTAGNWSSVVDIEQSGRIMTLIVRDIDEDSDLDILASTRATPNVGVFWQESDGLDPPTFTRHNISTQDAIHGNSHVFMLFEPGDLDDDGDDDICASTDATVLRCMYNQDSDGAIEAVTGDWLSWTPQFVPYPTAFGDYTSATICDVDQDTYMDVVVGSFNAAATTESGIVIMRRVPGASPTWERVEVTGATTSLQKVDNIICRDLNGDGFPEIFYGDQGDEDANQEAFEGVAIRVNPC